MMYRLFLPLLLMLGTTLLWGGSNASAEGQGPAVAPITTEQKAEAHVPKPLTVLLKDFFRTTGIYALIHPEEGVKTATERR